MPLNETVVDSVAGSNFKTLGEGPAFYAQLAMGNAVSNQQNMNAIQQAAIGTIVNKLANLDVEEAVSVLKASTGNDVAAAISSLMSATKASQTTPPVTP